jgi:hypothetical protein
MLGLVEYLRYKICVKQQENKLKRHLRLSIRAQEKFKECKRAFVSFANLGEK